MKYPFEVILEQNGDHVYWLAKSKTLEFVVGNGKTPEEAIELLSEMEQVWLESCEDETEIPPVSPTAVPVYSGKISLRMSKSTHATAAKVAEENGISLNQYINEAILARNTSGETADKLIQLFLMYENNKTHKTINNIVTLYRNGNRLEPQESSSKIPANN